MSDQKHSKTQTVVFSVLGLLLAYTLGQWVPEGQGVWPLCSFFIVMIMSLFLALLKGTDPKLIELSNKIESLENKIKRLETLEDWRKSKKESDIKL